MLKYTVATAALSATILAFAQPVSGQTRDIVGTVRTARDSSVVVGVVVEVAGLSNTATSDSSGFFALRGLPARDHSLVFSRLGIAPDTLPVPLGTDSVEVFLALRPVEISRVVATVEATARERFDESAQASAVTIDAEDVQLTPTLLEPDVLRTVQLLPGTVAINDYTVGYNARGGEADQNLIQLDGVTVFNPSHVGGLFSTFDAQAVGEVDYLTGGIPAHYSGRLSSVLDIGLRPGNTDSGVMGMVSLLSSKLLVEGPLPSKNSSFLVGVRRTYADKVIPLFTKYELPYYFTDGVGKFAFPLPNGGIFTVTGYIGNDVLDYDIADAVSGAAGLTLRVDWGNRLLGLSYDDLIFGKPLRLGASITEFSTTVGLFPSIVQIDNDVRLLTAKAELGLSPGRTHDVRVGVGVEDYRMLYDFRSDALSATFLNQGYQPQVWSAFVDDLWRPNDRLMIRPGVRMEAVSGGADVVTLSPRVAAKAFVTEDFALTGSVGRYYQPIHSLRDHNSPWSFVDFWIGADAVTPVGRSDHVVLGFERWFASNISLSVEGYRKTFHDVLNINVGDDPAVLGDEFVPMSGDAYGLDVLLRKYSGKWNGWVSYSFGKAIRQDPTQRFSPAHDRRHLLNLVVTGPGLLGSRTSLRWGYGSPLPYSQIVGQWEHRDYWVDANGFSDEELEQIADPQLNGRRYPHYSRLDLSFRWEMGFFGGVIRPFLHLVNLYNRRNVFFYYFDYSESPGYREPVPQAPFIPSFGAEFEF